MERGWVVVLTWTFIISLSFAALLSVYASQEQEIEQLIKQLRNLSDVGNAAADELVTIGEPAIPALIEALSDENAFARSQAAGALGRIGEQAIPALIETLSNADVFTRSLAASALGDIGEQAVDAEPALIKQCRH